MVNNSPVLSNVIAVSSKRHTTTSLAELRSNFKHLAGLLCSCKNLLRTCSVSGVVVIHGNNNYDIQGMRILLKQQKKCEGYIQMFPFAPGVTPLLKCHGTKEK